MSEFTGFFDIKRKTDNVMTTLGASSHSLTSREQNDYYATDPVAGKLLLELEEFDNILEPAAGCGHLSKVFIEQGELVTSTDIVDRGFCPVKNFFHYTEWNGDIITNPPYKYAVEFWLHALSIIPKGNKVALLLRLQFLEGKKRGELFEKYPPKTVYVSRSRIHCAKNAEFDGEKGSAVAYAWFVWQKGFTGITAIKWFN